MFSVVFPGQGSQTVGMSHDFYTKYDLFKKTFKEADEILNFKISKLILEGPKEDLDKTENDLKTIIKAERLKLSQQPKIVDDVRNLNNEFENR